MKKNNDICEHKHNHEHESHHSCCNHEHNHEHESHHSCYNHEHNHEHNHCCNEHDNCSCHEHGDGCMCGEISIKPLIIKFIISIVLLAITHYVKLPDILNIILLLIMYFVMAFDVIKTAITSLFSSNIFSETFLVTVATIGAFITGEYPEAIAVVFLYQLGEYFQDKASDNSKRKILETLNLKSDSATLVKDNITKEVNPKEINIDDTILVKPGEKIPLDGIVIEGNSYIDTSSLTGESVPRKACKDDSVLSGCINQDSVLYIKVTSTYSNSTASKIIDLIENANAKKSKTENFITKFAKIYTPIVVFLAVILAILPPIITGDMNFSAWIYKSCGFLVASCPCALVISVPLGFLAGIGSASKHGIIVKGSNYLDALSHTGSVVFDKTGTLTKGEFAVQDINIYDKKYTKEDILKITASIEELSTHPLGKSIVAEYKQLYNKIIDSTQITNFSEIKGKGLSAYYEDKLVLIGNKKLLESNHVAIQTDTLKNNVSDNSSGYIYISIDSSHVADILISDALKDDSKQAIEHLSNLNITTHLLTGDHHDNAVLVAKHLGIDNENVYAELLPTDKVSHLENILEKSHHSSKNVIFTGDGINDAPVLARADIGIAMGGVGSDSAIEASDIILMTDEPSKIPVAIKIAKYTMKIVKQNVIGSLLIKAVILVLLAIGISSMWLAVFADVGVCLMAIANASRVIYYKA